MFFRLNVPKLRSHPKLCLRNRRGIIAYLCHESHRFQGYLRHTQNRAASMLVHRLRRWANIEPALGNISPAHVMGVSLSSEISPGAIMMYLADMTS